MRPLLTFAAIFLAAAPASAGIRAVYAGADGGRIVIEAADDGDARAQEVGSDDYVVVRDGIGYVIGAATAGTRPVMRIADIAVGLDSLVAPVFGDVFTRPSGRPEPLGLVRIVPTESRETLAGKEGRVVQVYGADPARPDRPVAHVVSDSAALAAIGQGLEAYLMSTLLPRAVLTGPGAGLRAELYRRLFALGTPLTIGVLRLESVEQAEVPPTRMALPSAPLTREQMLSEARR